MRVLPTAEVRLGLSGQEGTGVKAPWLSPGQRTATRYDDLRFYQQAGCPPGARTFHDLANEVMRTVTATPHRYDAIDGLID